MMKRTDTWVATLVTPALCLGLVSDSRAELIDRGTYDGVRLIYDSAQRITWLGDANWAKTSGFDPNGEMTWDEARAWAGGLTIGGFSDWRLPITSDETCRGAGCTNSEMGHLFAVEGVSSTDPGPFLNVQGRQYWSSRSYSSEPDLAWYVHFGNGDQAVTGKSDSHMPWAVRDGDVGSEVSNDTKPGSFLVRVNLGSHGSTPVTVLGSVLLNEDDIDVNTLTLTLGTAPPPAFTTGTTTTATTGRSSGPSKARSPKRCIWAGRPNRRACRAIRAYNAAVEGNQASSAALRLV